MTRRSAIAWIMAKVFQVSIGTSCIVCTGCRRSQLSHTLRGRVLAEVLLLVAAEEALRLDGGSRTTRELLVEVDNTLHAEGIRSGANCLDYDSFSIHILD